MAQRTPGQSVINVSLPTALLKEIDRRADSLDLPRSRYIAAIAQQDIAKGGSVTIAVHEEPEPGKPIELNPFAHKFLVLAIPALTQYQDRDGQCPDPEAPEDIAEEELWDYFLKQRRHILDRKWTDSQKAGQDIGMERTLRGWLQRNPELWVNIPLD